MKINESNWNDMEWEFVRKGIHKKVFTGEGATVTLNIIDPGHEPKPHHHVHEQIIYIMQGECDFYADGEKHQLKAGGLMVIPSNVEHYIVATGKEQVVDLDIFTPKRDEYVK